jgi:hypothetical protein
MNATLDVDVDQISRLAVASATRVARSSHGMQSVVDDQVNGGVQVHVKVNVG